MIRDPMPTLLGADAPRVLTVPMLAAALSDGRSLPARGTLFNWLRAQRKSGVLRPVTRSLYLNQLAQPRPQAAEAQPMCAPARWSACRQCLAMPSSRTTIRTS